jgi:hypothetical protein
MTIVLSGGMLPKLQRLNTHLCLLSSNGVQLGDVGSARGVVGVWTTTTHEQGLPLCSVVYHHNLNHIL